MGLQGQKCLLLQEQNRHLCAPLQYLKHLQKMFNYDQLVNTERP